MQGRHSVSPRKQGKFGDAHLYGQVSRRRNREDNGWARKREFLAQLNERADNTAAFNCGERSSR